MPSDARANETNSAAPRPTSRGIRQEYLLWLPALVSLLLYVPTLNHGVVTDDRFLIVENPYIASFSGLRTLWTEDLWAASSIHLDGHYYRPLAMTTYWLQILLFGSSIWWLRLGNILLQAATSTLLARLLLRTNPKLGIPLTSFAATLWAVHPMQSESVIWLSGRFDVLVVLLAVLTLLVNHHPRRIVFVPLTLALALLSKEIGIALFPAIIGADIVRLGGLRPALKDEGPKWLGMSFVVGGYLLLRKLLGIYGANDLIGGLAPSVFLSGLAELSITYVRLTFLPIGLDVHHWYTARATGVGIVILVAHFIVIAMAVAYAWKRKQGMIVAGTMLSTIALMLSSNIGPSQTVYGDRFWSFTGLALVFVIAEVFEWRPPLSRQRLLPWSIATVVLGLLTLFRGNDWKSEEHLAATALERDPNNRHWLLLSSHHQLRRGQVDQAREMLVRLVEIEPRMAKAHNALCVAELRTGHLERAEQECRLATELTPNNASTWVNLASVFVNAKRYEETEAAAEKALSIQSKNVEAEYLLAIVKANRGAFEEARKHLARGLSYSPRHVGLRKLEAQLGQKSGPDVPQ